MTVIPKIPRASGGPYQGSTLDQLGTLSGPQTPRLLTPPLTTNPESAPGQCQKIIHLDWRPPGCGGPRLKPIKPIGKSGTGNRK